VKSLFEASVKKARNGPSTQLIEIEATTPRLKPKSTATFLVIKRKQRTKIVEVINPQKSLSKSGRS
jgi:hypothetical protein